MYNLPAAELSATPASLKRPAPAQAIVPHSRVDGAPARTLNECECSRPGQIQVHDLRRATMQTPIVASRLAASTGPRLARAALLMLALLLSACAPSAPPSPTAAPKPTEAPKPAAPAAAASPAPRRPAGASPAAAPAASPAAAVPAASPGCRGRGRFAGRERRRHEGAGRLLRWQDHSDQRRLRARGRVRRLYASRGQVPRQVHPGQPDGDRREPAGRAASWRPTVSSRTRQDGTALANIGGPIILNQLFATSGVEYDMAKFEYSACRCRRPTPCGSRSGSASASWRRFSDRTGSRWCWAAFPVRPSSTARRCCTTLPARPTSRRSAATTAPARSAWRWTTARSTALSTPGSRPR